MTLTKIGASLGGSADIINVTQTSHTFVSNDRGKAVKMTNDSGTPKYMLATADAVGNADAIGIIINVADGNNFTMAVSGRITVDGCVPNEVAGTVLFLHTAATGGAAIDATDSGHLTSTEPSGNTEVSKPMAVITIANSEMIMLQQRGEVISTGAVSIGDESVDSDHYVDGSIDNAHLANMAANTVKVRDASSSGVPSDKAVADTQILIGDGTGFTAATPGGDVSAFTNAGAVTIASSHSGSAHHADAHTVASHSDTSGTGAELETLTDGSNAESLHTHTHTVVSHSDTTATGAELETLTDGSTTALHAHAGSALQSTRLNGSRLASAGSGPEVINEVGFTPTTVLVIALDKVSSQVSWGWGDDGAYEAMVEADAGSFTQTDGRFITIYNSSAENGYIATLTSFHSTNNGGCTIAWTRIGSGLDVHYIMLFLR